MALILATFGYCLVSGLAPIVNAELYLLSIAVLAPPQLRLPLAAAAALGQIIGKTMLYGVARGAIRLPGGRVQVQLDRARKWASGRRIARGPLVLVSAATGLPPFYLLTLALGIARAPVGSFMALGFAGRLIRFAALVMVPSLFGASAP